MLLSHKIELRPVDTQVAYFNEAMGIRRHCYNQFVEHFSLPWNSYNYSNVRYLIVALKAEFPWYRCVSHRVVETAIRDFDNAMKAFFRRAKAGARNPGFPKFKKRGSDDSFSVRNRGYVNGRLLKLERLWLPIKMREQLRFEGNIRVVTISKLLNKYYAAITVDVTNYDKKILNRSESVGIDFGIKNIAVCSNGKIFGPSNRLRTSLVKLKRLQKLLSRKKRGSNRYARAKLRLGKLHLSISRQRCALLHSVSDYVTSKFDRIVIEDLNVKGMVKNHNLALSLMDAGFGSLRAMIGYKSILRGNELVIADRFFPSSKLCSKCGSKKELLSLNDRVYNCDCGLSMDRDLNAAINLNAYSRESLKPDSKRTKELSKTEVTPSALMSTL